LGAVGGATSTERPAGPTRDAAGRVWAVQDPLGCRTTGSYDAAGRRLAETAGLSREDLLAASGFPGRSGRSS
jgi:YD repeat-containing protein